MVYDSQNKIWCGPIHPPLFNPELSLGYLMMNSIKLTPDRILLVCDDLNFTCNEIYEKSVKMIKYFKSIGLKQNDVVGLIATSTPNLFPTVIACLTLGLPINPLSTLFNENDIFYMFSMTKPKIIVCDANFVEIVENSIKRIKINCKILTLIEKIKDFDFVGDVFRNFKFDDFEFPNLINISTTPAFIMCSSGTTSMVKGVIRTHKQLIHSLVEFPSVRGEPKIHFTSIVSFYWISSVFFLCQMLLFGATLVTTTRPISAEHFMDFIEEKKVTFVQFYPLILQILKQSGKLRSLKCVRHVLIGGCVIDEKYVNDTKKVFPSAEIFAGYGNTEVGIVTSAIVKKYLSSSGVPCPNVKFKIIDGDGNNLGPKKTGEICFQSPAMFSSYFDDPEKTSEAIIDNWFHSGDVGYFNEDEFIFVQERKKDMLKYYGLHFTPLEIENIINEIEDVVASVIVGVKVYELDITYAFVIKKENSKLIEENVKSFVNSRVIESKIIRGDVIFVEKFPLTPTGKVKRYDLRKIAQKIHDEKLNSLL